MRPPAITRQRCLDQALVARLAAAAASTEREHVRLIRIAVAYEALATKAR